jgi:uncharacterized membrane protein
MSETDLSGPPPSMSPSSGPGQTPPPSPPPAPQGGFEFNYPTIVSLLYLSSFVLGVTAIVGVVLAYVWKGESREAWEASHYEYLINTFWLGLVGSIIGFVLIFILIGIPILLAVMALMVVRSVLSLIRAQKHEPMPNPGTWLA